jgi:hypothetical protein
MIMSYLAAKAAEAHFIADNLSGPHVKDIVRCMFGEDIKKRLSWCSNQIAMCSVGLMTYRVIQKPQSYDLKTVHIMSSSWINQQIS